MRLTRIPKRGRVWENPRSLRTLLRRSGLPAHNVVVHPKRTARFDYVNAGASWFGFYLDEGALALANDGARFNSFGAVLAWAGEHDFEFVAKCEPEGSARVATEMRRNGGRI